MKLYDLKLKIKYMIPYWIRNSWDNIRFFINPRQKWLIKQIPNSWIDKDTLFELVILESVKHYVEKDGGLSFNDNWIDDYNRNQKDSEYPDWQKKFDREVKKNYELITITLPQLEKELQITWDKVPHPDLSKGFETGLDYKELYGEVDKIQKQIDDLKDKVLVWAVKRRKALWT